MTEEERYNKTSEIIAKFKNGMKRYRTSALFNQVVQSLVRGADPIDIIDQLITTTEDTGQALIEHMHRDPRPGISMSEFKSNFDG